MMIRFAELPFLQSLNFGKLIGSENPFNQLMISSVETFEHILSQSLLTWWVGKGKLTILMLHSYHVLFCFFSENIEMSGFLVILFQTNRWLQNICPDYKVTDGDGSFGGRMNSGSEAEDGPGPGPDPRWNLGLRGGKGSGCSASSLRKLSTSHTASGHR